MDKHPTSMRSTSDEDHRILERKFQAKLFSNTKDGVFSAYGFLPNATEPCRSTKMETQLGNKDRLQECPTVE